MQPVPNVILAILLFGGCSVSGGCVSMMAGSIAAAPNVRKPDILLREDRPPLPESLLGVDQHFRVEVGPPRASLSVCVLHPDDRDQPPKGTILVLHGMGARSAWMHGKAMSFADEGYRAVLVDLRGHGASTGTRLTYGLREAQDLSHVIDALDGRGLLVGRVGVLGISYGATTAIHLAAYDRRVAAVVALAPFADMRSEVSHYTRTIGFPGIGPLMSEEKIQAAVDEAGHIGGYDPDDADATRAIRAASARVLLVHGKADVIIPYSHSQRIHEAAPDRTELLLLPGLGHFTIWVDPLGHVDRAARDWFNKYLPPRY